MTTTAPSPTDMARTLRTEQPRARDKPSHGHRRGDIWYVSAGHGDGGTGNEMWSDRPAVVVSNNVLNAHSGIAQVVYLSASPKKRSGPVHVEIASYDRPGATTMVLCEQVHSVDASRLVRREGVVGETDMLEVDAALTISLGLGRNPGSAAHFRKWEKHVQQNGIDIAKEIEALAGRTTNDRVEALARALEQASLQRDSWRNLYETEQAERQQEGKAS